MITRDLIQTILVEYALPQNSIHGLTHWARVLEYGRILAESTGADKKTVELFAIFHDSKRVSDGRDTGHGKRGADFAASLRGTCISLADEDFDNLYFACAHHTDGLTDAVITIQTCWDADRLDLPRAGIRIKPNQLCTQAAKERKLIEWATKRAVQNVVPDLVYTEWRFEPGRLSKPD